MPSAATANAPRIIPTTRLGSGRAATSGDELVPVGKAYFGFTDEELLQIDRFVRRNTIDRFGPVREVVHEPGEGLVLEVAFEGLQRSTRHKSGLAMRFPRINRLRWDKPPGEADRLERLETISGADRSGASVVKRSRATTAVAAKLRRGRFGDLDALIALEERRLHGRSSVATELSPFSRRAERRADRRRSGRQARGLCARALPATLEAARLYSIAVAPHIGKRGIGPLLLAAAEDGARRRGRRSMRLEVHEHNSRAIARYEKSGYRLFGRHRDYYDDRATRCVSRSRWLYGTAPRSAVHRKPDSARANRFSWWTSPTEQSPIGSFSAMTSCALPDFERMIGLAAHTGFAWKGPHP